MAATDPIIRLVLSDVDGTLRPAGLGQIPERTIRAIDALRKEGVSFGPATGRAPADVLPVFRSREDCLRSGILSAGKEVFFEGRRVFCRPLPHAALLRAQAAVEGLGDAALFVYCEPEENPLGPGGRWVAVPIDDDSVPEALAGSDYAIPGLELAMEVPERPIYCAGVGVSGGPERLSEVRDLVEAACPELELVSPGFGWYDLNELGWSKADGLRMLLELTGLAPEEIAFVGDSDNDVTMMEALPHTFCVDGGSPAALAAARWRVPSAGDLGPALLMESVARNHGRLVVGEFVL